MSNELHYLEESLKEFLISIQSGSDNSRNANLYKYNNLKIIMEPNQEKTPHFIIRIGISESMYSILTGVKMAGGLESDERLIRKWFDKPFIRDSLDSAWIQSKKTKIVSVKNSDGR